jgi:hypothetical protein
MPLAISGDTLDRPNGVGLMKWWSEFQRELPGRTVEDQTARWQNVHADEDIDIGSRDWQIRHVQVRDDQGRTAGLMAVYAETGFVQVHPYWASRSLGLRRQT